MSDKNKRARGPSRRGGGPMGHGGPMAMMPGAKAGDFKGTMRKFLKYLSKYNALIAVVAVFAVASTVFAVIGPKILGLATTRLFENVLGMMTGASSGVDFAYIGSILTLLAAIYAASAAFSYVQGFIMSRVSNNVTYNLRRDISEKIHRLPLKYFDEKSYGEVLSHITNDVDAINQSLSQSLTQIITSVATLIGILVMMLTISWQMTIIAICILPVSMLFITFVVKSSHKHFKNQQNYLGNLNGHIEEMYGSHVIVKAFCGEEQSEKTFDESNEKLYGAAWRSNFLSGLMMPVMGFIGNLGYVAICILGGWLAVNGRLAVGDIQAFIQYVRQFTHPIMQVANISNVLQQTMAAAERIFVFLEEDEETPDKEGTPDTGGITGAVEFEHIRFGYSPEKTVISDFTAAVRPGQKVAIVGPTGAGKTTIVKLLMRFYELDGGKIYLDGIDSAKLKRNDLRSVFGMVLQDTWLFGGTIRENIRYGRLDATDAEVVAAAKAAQVDHFVRTLPDGFDTELNEEADNVSQGEKQLLTIARAILADPKILILDEATSSVDTRTELLIQKAMDNLMAGRTSFVIAHRLSTIKNADMILVMNDGDIVETGNHDELLKSGGFYAKLYLSQFEETA